MSLHLLRVIKSFKIRHRPEEKINLRIGVHVGASSHAGLRLWLPERRKTHRLKILWIVGMKPETEAT